MEYIRKAAALLLCAAIASACLGCSASNGGTEASDGSVSGQDQTLTETETAADDERLLISDGLPDVGFDGCDFVIASRENYTYEVFTEADDADILVSALYNRNLRIEERFDISISALVYTETEDISYISSLLTSGDDSIDMIMSKVYVTSPLIMNGLLYNLKEMKYIDFSKPWWISGINEKFSINGSICTAVGSTCLSTLMQTFVMYFDKTNAGDYLGVDLYSTVNSGLWTIDYFAQITKNLYDDLDGNSVIDTDDFVAFAGESATATDAWTFAFDIPMIKNNSEGMPEIVIKTDKTQAALEKINKLYWENPGSLISTVSTGWNWSYETFFQHNAIFMTNVISNMYNDALRDYKYEYGVLPYPKWDEAQEKYLSGVRDVFSVISVPVYIAEPERTGIIIEAINADSYKYMYPTYYETALQDKFARDEETIAMLDVIMEGRSFDMATLFSTTLTGLPWMFRDLVMKNSNDLESAYASVERNLTRTLERILEKTAGSQSND